MKLTNKMLRSKVKQLNQHLLEEYRKAAKAHRRPRDFQHYEQDVMRRIKTVMRNLELLIREATVLQVYRGNGRKPKLAVAQKLRIFLVKQLIEKSNRNMACMLDIFCMLSGIDISYKTVERLYSDVDLRLALHNLHALLLKKRQVKKIDACGDATGYSLMISKHYASFALQKKNQAKEQHARKKQFAYQFVLMDLKTKMYVCYGTSMISERKAFDKAMSMLQATGVKIDSVRLDRYYSFPCYARQFPNAEVYIIPRKDSKLGHGKQWLHIMRTFMQSTMEYLGQYYLRNNSENGFAIDKKMLGWSVRQKRYDRIDTAVFSKTLWHNLFYVY